MKRRLVALLLAVLAVLQLGASTSREYVQTYKDHTRELFIYHDFGTALILRGTLLTAPMRSAIVEERARLMNPLPEDQTAFVAKTKEELDAYHEVVFSADSGLPAGDKFRSDEGEEGWRVRLEADGTLETLVTLFQVRKPSMLQRALFKHYNIWSDLWVARFHRTVADPRRVEMHLGSGYGSGSLVWDDLR